MAYIGNEPGLTNYVFGLDRFNGTGACTQFTLTRTTNDANTLEVLVNSIQQDPINSYSVSGGVVTFTEAPSSGSNNIVVIYRATSTISYSNITTAQINDGAVTTAKLATSISNNSTIAWNTANAAFLAANTPSHVANSAAIYANGAFATANAATTTNITQNNSITAAFNTANAAFVAANAANLTDTTQNNSITAAFATANSAASYANAAFTSSNTKATTASPTFSGFVGIGKTGAVALDVNGAIHGNTIFRNTEGGSAAVPSFQPGNDNDTGMFWGGSNIIGFSTGAIERLEIDASGTVTLANGLSIGRTAVTGTPAATDGNVFSGTYTPTLTNSSGINSSAASACQYMRVGNVVTVSGQVQIAPTGSDFNMKMTLPIASAFTASRQASGHFLANGSYLLSGGTIAADVAGDRFLFLGNDTTTANLIYIFTTTYQVL